MSAWQKTIESGDALSAQHLITSGQDVEEELTEYGHVPVHRVDHSLTYAQETALHIASREGHLPLVRVLLRNGAKSDRVVWKTGDTALLLALSQRHTEVALVLIEKGADVNLSNTMTGKSPLHLAAEIDDVEVAENLLENQADINSTCLQGNTPLHTAASIGHLPFVRLLMGQRELPLVSKQNKDQMTAMDLAAKEGEFLIVQEIASSSTASLTDPLIPIQHGNLGIALWLMESGAMVDDPRGALKELLAQHLFHSRNEYSSSQKRQRSQNGSEEGEQRKEHKRRRTSANASDPPQVILLDESSDSEDDSPPTLTQTLMGDKTIFGVNLKEAEKLFTLLISQATNEKMPMSLEQHLQTFLFPLLRFYQSSDPGLFLQCQRLIEQSGIISTGNQHPSASHQSATSEASSGEELSQANSGSPPNRSLLVGSFDDIRRASQEMNVNIKHLQEIIHLLQLKKQLIFRGPPGTGKSFLAKNLAQRMVSPGGEWQMVQFHPNYSYEDFMIGFRPVAEYHQVGYQLRDGPMVAMIRQALEAPTETFVMVIDEINRGNVPQIFGELFYLLDDRAGQLQLQYGTEKLQLPHNVYVIATMNTADRSIALLDDALMRRFHFVDLHDVTNPEGIVYHIFRNWCSSLDCGVPVDTISHALFDLIARVNKILGSADKNLGPSYFMKSDLWPKIRYNQGTFPTTTFFHNLSHYQELREQCELNMDLTWQYSVVPYIHNALTYESDPARIQTQLRQIWSDFKQTIFLPLPQDSQDDDSLRP